MKRFFDGSQSVSETKPKDWTGNSTAVYSTLGASNHSTSTRADNDFYATHPKAIDGLLSIYGKELPKTILEPFCGMGHISERLTYYGYNVISEDLVNRGYGSGGIDFLKRTNMPDGCDCIISNPPYNKAKEMVLHGLSILPEGGQLIFFLKTTFVEGLTRRKEIFDRTPPKYLFQFSERIPCAKNGDFSSSTGSAVAYAWYVWQKNWTGDTTIKWI